jgi:hypothetical protein
LINPLVPGADFRLSHFSLHAPSEMLGYWFVSYDFADALNLEYSRTNQAHRDSPMPRQLIGRRSCAG